MKIEGPSKTSKTTKSDKASKAGKSDGTFGAMVTSGATQTQGTAATQSIAKMDALLAVQAAGSATERAAKKRMRERGDKVLRQLDNLRLGILTGNLNLGEMVNIADVVASHRESIDDPQLTALLDEIDLRAQIEIAKIRKAMEHRGL